MHNLQFPETSFPWFLDYGYFLDFSFHFCIDLCAYGNALIQILWNVLTIASTHKVDISRNFIIAHNPGQ